MCKSCLECVQKMSLVVCACLLLPLKAALLSPSAALCADGGCCWECHPWGNTPWDTKQWLLAGPGRERKGQRRVRRTRREGARTKAKACGVCVCVCMWYVWEGLETVSRAGLGSQCQKLALASWQAEMNPVMLPVTGQIWEHGFWPHWGCKAIYKHIHLFIYSWIARNPLPARWDSWQETCSCSKPGALQKEQNQSVPKEPWVTP